MRVALDAMGGDLAPCEITRGAALAMRNLPDVELVLVGDEKILHDELRREGNPERVTVFHASQAVGMNERGAEVLRKKPDSSIVRAVELVVRKEAHAVVSAGNTGAVVAASTLLMGLLPGVKRPGIAITFATQSRLSTIIDVGANINCKPVHLLQYGAMAGVYNRCISHAASPTVGLLNIGQEDEKGTSLVKETHDLLKGSHLNFVGNIEGRDIHKGVCDVVVCEGFVGNVILKATEGLAEYLLSTILKEISRAGLDSSHPVYRSAIELKRQNDYSEYGGAPLLGVNGITIICHGSSDAKAIFNAVRAACDFEKLHLNQDIVQELKRLPSRVASEREK
jgi:glycerol-3-phosphate acyltransferase PlsX